MTSLSDHFYFFIISVRATVGEQQGQLQGRQQYLSKGPLLAVTFVGVYLSERLNAAKKG